MRTQPSLNQQPTSPLRKTLPRDQLRGFDQAMLLLIPKYRWNFSINPTSKTVKSWSNTAIETLRDCFDCTAWDVSSTGANSLNKLTDTMTSYVNFCVEMCIPTKTVKKPTGITNHGSQKTFNYRTRKKNFISGDTEQYNIAKYKLMSEIRKAKWYCAI